MNEITLHPTARKLREEVIELKSIIEKQFKIIQAERKRTILLAGAIEQNKVNKKVAKLALKVLAENRRLVMPPEQTKLISEAALAALQDLANNPDTERQHIQADAVVYQLLNSLGQVAVAEQYRSMCETWWYA